MQEPEVSRPEITIDVTSDGEEETVTKPHKRSHGGLCNTKMLRRQINDARGAQHSGLSYAPKGGAAVDKTIFSNCHSRDKAEGERIVYDLRSQRIESESMHHHNNGTQ